MRKTLDDLLRDWSGQQPERKTPWRALRGRLWLDHALWLSGLEWAQFERICIQRNRSASKLGGKWRAGTTLPTRSSAQAMERVLPGTAWVFDLALFQLLSNEPLTRSRLTALTANFRQPGLVDGHCWRLPHRDGVAISHDYIQPSKWTLTPNKLDEAISQTGRRRWYQKRSAGSDVAALPPIVCPVTKCRLPPPNPYGEMQKPPGASTLGGFEDVARTCSLHSRHPPSLRQSLFVSPCPTPCGRQKRPSPRSECWRRCPALLALASSSFGGGVQFRRR